MRARALLLAGLLALAAGDGALAHRLKLFAAVAGLEVSGYGFFVGGGRPAGVTVVARDAAGTEVWRGPTGDDGAFTFTVAKPETLTLTLDAGDGHAATETLAADRFTAAAPSTPAPTPAPAEGVAAAPAAVAVSPDAAAIAPELEARIAERVAATVAAEVDRAVGRQIRPLLEAQAAAEARVRVNDILGGLGWIAGLVGVALIVARRRRS